MSTVWGEKPARSLCKFLGAVHDIGKATPYFQLKRSFRRDEELDEQILENLKSAGFKELDKFYTATELKESHQSMGQFMLAKRGVNMTVADIVGAHHGRPMPITKSMDISNTNFFYQVNDANSEIYKTWMDIHDELFNRALEAAGYESVDEIPLISQPAQVLFSALLIMADWITSNEKYFPLIDIAIAMSISGKYFSLLVIQSAIIKSAEKSTCAGCEISGISSTDSYPAASSALLKSSS